MMKKTRNYVRKDRPYPRRFPCGCYAVTYTNAGKRQQTQGYVSILILKDGRRACTCGKMYRCVWVEAKD